MARFTTDIRLTFEAEDVNEAHLAAVAMLPEMGAMHLPGGDVITLVGRAVAGARPESWAPANALWIDADDIRDEAKDGNWSAAVEEALAKVDDKTLNGMLSDQFGDDFWHAMHGTYADVITQVCDDAGIPLEDR
jgi:hypothetical protein